jgi:mannose/fructose/sorbose-specific phosphotransferase system IID component
MNMSSIMDKKLFKRTFWRSLALQGGFNFERQQAVGFLYGMVPALEKIYADDPEGLKEALKRHTEYFNTSPQFVTFVTGASIAMEEQRHDNKDFDPEAITGIKLALMGPLAGIGDSLFWGTLRTIGLGVGVALAIKGNYLGPLLFILIHNVPHYIFRWKGLDLGYKQGMNFLANAVSGGIIEEVTSGAKLVGTLVVGAMIGSMINFTTSITLNFGETSYAIQSLFDSLMPQLLPLLLTFGVFKLMKKISATKLMFALLLLGILIVFLEGLPFFVAPTS